jgi:AbrB family looped-hinge helix DNA binding protein
MMVSTVTDKGQVTLPKAIRDRLGIRPGTKLDFELGPDDTLRVRVLSRGSAGLYGLLAKPGEPSRSIKDMEAAVDAAVRERGPARR